MMTFEQKKEDGERYYEKNSIGLTMDWIGKRKKNKESKVTFSS